jgi:hypothetical protein
VEYRRPQDHPRPERALGQERQHFLLSLPTAQICWLFFDLGNTLVDERAATEARLREVASCFERHGEGCSVEDIRSALREASVEFTPRLITAAIGETTTIEAMRP